VIIGVRNRLELWNPDRWRQETDKLLDGSLNVDERLRELGI
jgi:DNA-binding transcriptional regulator/RsmH inhibitor MraZ